MVLTCATAVRYPAHAEINIMFNPCPKPIKREKKKPTRIGPGKKTLEWEAAKKKLNPAFARVGLLNFCEVGYYLYQFPEHAEAIEKHRHNYFLTYAHGDKRNNLVGNELITLVARACVDCHDYIEYRPDMRQIVEAVIAARKVQPETYYYGEATN